MVKTSAIVSLAAGLIFGINYLVQQQDPNLSILSPISKSFSILAFTSKRTPPNKIVYGYLPYWTIKDGKYLQMDKLTDIAYFGLYLDENGDFIRYENGETNPGYNNWLNNEDLDKIIREAKNNNVRFSLTVVSHVDEVSDKFLACRDCWDNLANNLIEELNRKEIKDVNLNFEYVELVPEEKADQYTQFVDFLNKRLDDEYGDSQLVVSTFADSIVKNRITNIEDLGSVADALFIMGYDFHRPTSDNAGPVSPINGKGVHAEYDINTMLKDYLAFVPPNKLILGVPYYGYNWVVETEDEYAKRINGSDEYGFSQSQTYESIMETLITIKPELKWDELAQSPYFTYRSPETGYLRSVYFDNEQSLAVKYQLINDNDLAGVGIWALGYDGGYSELWNLLEKYFKD
jgi:spore germination protein YaaH